MQERMFAFLGVSEAELEGEGSEKKEEERGEEEGGGELPPGFPPRCPELEAGHTELDWEDKKNAGEEEQQIKKKREDWMSEGKCDALEQQLEDLLY